MQGGVVALEPLHLLVGGGLELPAALPSLLELPLAILCLVLEGGHAIGQLAGAVLGLLRPSDKPVDLTARQSAHALQAATQPEHLLAEILLLAAFALELVVDLTETFQEALRLAPLAIKGFERLRIDALKALDLLRGSGILSGGLHRRRHLVDLELELGAFALMLLPSFRELVLRGREFRQGRIALDHGLIDEPSGLGASGLHAPCAVA